MNSLLEEVGEKYQPTKRLHNYLPAYATHLESRESSWWDKNVLSISFYRYLTVIQKGANPQEGEAAVRIME